MNKKQLIVAGEKIMRKLIFLICFSLLAISFAYAFNINNISINLTDGKLVISSPKGEILNHASGGLLCYEYILETPYFEMGGYDGVVEIEHSKGIRGIPKSNLTADSFPKFPFFSQESDTIGLLIGSAGGSGGSSQNVYFINTRTGVLIKVELTDMQGMEWIKKDGRPIGFKEYDTVYSFGPRATSWGHKARITSVNFFDKDGNITFDRGALNDILKSEYNKISFSAEEKLLLQKDIMSDMKYRQLGEKLVDYVYYGFKIGKKNEVLEFLMTLNPVYKQEVEYRID
jgi:hypothetical protein